MNNFVGMDMCPYCNEPKAILIHQHMKEIPQHCMTSPEPCDKCKAKFEADNVVPVWSTFTDAKGKMQFNNEYFFIKRDSVHGQQFIDMVNKLGFLVMKEEEFIKVKQYMEMNKVKVQS